MKTLLIFAAGALIAGSALAQGDISTPVVHHNALAPVTPAQSEGGIQRGFRLGNVFHMFNPFAPAEYGTGQEFVTYREEAGGGIHARPQGKPTGLKLFSFSFW
ncbi:MAG: hypothetical protein ABSE62_15230 [Chthoniobacteraceae bacterium]|jgi:hypothetical protein